MNSHSVILNGNYCDTSSNNASDETRLRAPEEFPFPFPPYSIQNDFMRKLYETLSEGKLGIFESPTGTGKSMSLICGSMKWLHDFEAQRRLKLEEAIKETEENDKENLQSNNEDWFNSYVEKKKSADKLMDLKTEYAKFKKLDGKLQNLREKRNTKKVVFEAKAIDELYEGFKDVKQALELQMKSDGELDEGCVLKEYVSDDESSKSSDTEELEDDLANHVTKIYLCSRTHSQLAQLVKEVKKSPYGNDVRLASLGSRQNSCINEAVQRLKSLSLMNDRCRELQQKKAKETKVSISGEVLKKKRANNGCQFYCQSRIEDLGDSALTDVKDIEELANTGRKMKACAYYASRHAQPMAEIVLLPYNTLLHKQTREALGISLKNNVVIIDEAHNLLDAISAIHSSQMTGAQLSGALSQLSQYKNRYSSRLKAKNMFYIQQIIYILKSLLKYLQGSDVSHGYAELPNQENVQMHTLNEFVLKTTIDNINLFKILHYCKKSELSRKLLGFSTLCQLPVKNLNGASEQETSVGAFLDKLSNGYTEVTQKISEKEGEVRIPMSPLMQIEEFLRCLTNDDRNGRVLMNQHPTLEKSYFKYYLLNPAAHFRDIVSDARAVVVAGGTMQPIDEFSDQLFLAAGAEQQRIVSFSCGHIIRANHLLSIALPQGPSGVTLDFSYQNRNSVSLIGELGRILSNLCNVVPGGIVCFFPSYDYETHVLSAWESSNVLNKISIKKKIFQECKEAGEANKILEDYSKCISKSKQKSNERLTGAILFSVVGGKMSEGINFNDDLARCVVMVGMPYPNIHSPELQEKMKYLNLNVSSCKDGRQPGQIYYENLCMKAVNQCIGRAIRHKEDYATILLLDARYGKPSVQRALPGWIQNGMQICPKFGPAFGSLRKFFAEKCVT